jgi:hypothetical protein
VKYLNKKESGLLWFSAFYGAIASKALDWIVSNVVVGDPLPPLAHFFATLAVWFLVFLTCSLVLFFILKRFNEHVEF